MSASSDKNGENNNQAREENGSNKASSNESAEQPHVAKTITITDIELESIKKELAECKDKYLRSLAESENARKRLQKEKQELIQFSLQNLATEFLNPIDHLENALGFTQQMSDEVKHWALGFQMILSQFKDVLANNGIMPFVSEGRPFDPHFHEAVESVETNDFPPGIIIEESLKGYKMGDRVIRPSRVKVSKSPSPDKMEKLSTNNGKPEKEQP